MSLSDFPFVSEILPFWSKCDATALLNGVYLDCEREFSNILNGGFLTDHSEPLGLVFDMPLCMLALWHFIRFIGSD